MMYTMMPDNTTNTTTTGNDGAAAVLLSDQAAARVKQLIAGKQGGDGFLRVYVQGGGCSGFQYGFQLDDNRAQDDLALEKNGVVMLVDSISLQYLAGAEVDFIDDLMGARFVVRNPNATATCGCGASFSA